jgi:hypothetical protein
MAVDTESQKAASVDDTYCWWDVVSAFAIGCGCLLLLLCGFILLFNFKEWWLAWAVVITPALLLFAEGLAALLFLFCAAYVIAKGVKKGGL